MKDKLILNNQTQIELEAGASLSNMMVLSETKYDMVSVWDMLTPENLKSVQIQNGDGVTVANYSDLVLDSETSNEQEDGMILTSFHLHEKTDVEKRLDALESNQDMLMGAVDDLGAITSTLAERNGGLS